MFLNIVKLYVLKQTFEAVKSSVVCLKMFW